MIHATRLICAVNIVLIYLLLYEINITLEYDD